MKEYNRLTLHNLHGAFAWEATHMAVEQAENIYNRLAELEDKIENGTLVELPCRVGDKVYFIREAAHKNPFALIIEETSIDKIIITKGALKVKLSCNSTYESSIRSFGKTMFFTREDAETRLKELEEQKWEMEK